MTVAGGAGPRGRAARRGAAYGQGAPEGRLYHVALERDGEVQVFDIWESQEAMEAFGPVLMPVLGGLGVDPGRPMVQQVRNIVEG